MANFSLQCLTKETGITRAFGDSAAAEILQKLWSHPVVAKYTEVFNNRLLSRLAEHHQEPNAVDWHTEHGDFVFEGLKPLLRSAINEQRLSLEHVCGAILLDDRFAIGTIYVPETSTYGIAARHGLFNTNVLFEGGRFVVTPYRALDGYISPKEVSGATPAPAFELSDDEELALEAGLVLKSVFAAGRNAIATRDEGRLDAFSANVRDVIEIIDYIKGLLARLDAVAADEKSISSVTPPALSAQM